MGIRVDFDFVVHILGDMHGEHDAAAAPANVASLLDHHYFMGNLRKNKALTTETLECGIRVWLRKEFPKTISQPLNWDVCGSITSL